MNERPQPVTLINLFEVPAGADEDFIAEWERARDFLKSRDAYLATALHQSLAPDARFRFVNVGRYPSAEAFQTTISQTDFPGGHMPYPAHPAIYDVVRQDGTEAERPGAVVLINPFTVPADADEQFLPIWEAARDALREQQGYLSTSLYRSLLPGADFRFVNIALWESPTAFQTATQQPGFRAVARMPFEAHPALYRVTRG